MDGKGKPVEFAIGQVENIEEKGDNAGLSFSCNIFKSLLYKGCQKSKLCDKRLSLSQMTNVRLFQIERVGRKQFQIC